LEDRIPLRIDKEALLRIMTGLVTRENGVQSHHGEIDSVYAQLPLMLQTIADFYRIAGQKRRLQCLRSRLSSVLGCNHPQTRRRIRFESRSLDPSCRYATRTLRRGQVDGAVKLTAQYGKSHLERSTFHCQAFRTNPNLESSLVGLIDYERLTASRRRTRFHDR
jgi:hypothetical protein